jgi:HTH-type transcriptional regulator / antitoxin HigA
MSAAEVFTPGEFLRDELEARGWTQAELGEIMGRPTRLINEIIAGKRAITPDTAMQLGEALGTSPDLWMNLESQYQLSKVHRPDNAVARRAALYARVPVKEMTVKRGWVVPSESIDVLEQNFASYFGVRSLDKPPSFAHAARRSHPEAEVSYIQLAWLFRCKALAASQVLSKYDSKKLRDALPKLRALMSAPEETRHVPRILAECGVRFVVVEALKGSKIDGASFWLDPDKPVIAMSLRLDRIDNFWFVLRHEIEHVLQRHGQDFGFILDQDVSAELEPDRVEEERIANAEASNFCVEKWELENFIARVQPLLSEERILLFAQRLQTHPGIIIGQLQNALGRHDLLRRHLVKIAHIVSKAAPSDGWGSQELT